MWNICAVEFYPAVKGNEIMKSEGKWVEPGKHTSEATQSLKHKCHVFFLMCSSQLSMSLFTYVCGCECRYKLGNWKGTTKGCVEEGQEHTSDMRVEGRRVGTYKVWQGDRTMKA